MLNIHEINIHKKGYQYFMEKVNSYSIHASMNIEVLNNERKHLFTASFHVIPGKITCYLYY